MNETELKVQDKIDKLSFKILSWTIENETKNTMDIKVKFFHNGSFGDQALLMDAAILRKGSHIKYTHQAFRVKSSEGIGYIKISAERYPDYTACSDQIRFFVYGEVDGHKYRNIAKSEVDFKKCWNDKLFKN